MTLIMKKKTKIKGSNLLVIVNFYGLDQLRSIQNTIDTSTDEFAENAKKVMENFKGNKYINPDGSIKNKPKLKVFQYF